MSDKANDKELLISVLTLYAVGITIFALVSTVLMLIFAVNYATADCGTAAASV